MRNLLIALALSACSHSPQATPLTADSAQESACNPLEGRADPHDFAGDDANKDRKISWDEYLCQVTKHFTDLDTDQDGYLSKAETKKAGAWAKIAERDTEGHITVMDFYHAAGVEFDLADRDQDGSLSPEEFRNYSAFLP